MKMHTKDTTSVYNIHNVIITNIACTCMYDNSKKCADPYYVIDEKFNEF